MIFRVVQSLTEGFFKKDSVHGTGKVTLSSGICITGKWKYGVLDITDTKATVNQGSVSDTVGKSSSLGIEYIHSDSLKIQTFNWKRKIPPLRIGPP